MSAEVCWAIVPAAGIGSRMAAGIPKQYLPFSDSESVLSRTLNQLTQYPNIKQVIVALHPEDTHWSTESLHHPEKIIQAVGGASRMRSVLNALELIKENASSNDWVLIHDAVRPFITEVMLNQLFDEIAGHPVGGVLVNPLSDTIKSIDEHGRIVSTVDRDSLVAAQTPQVFRFNCLYQALTTAVKSNQHFTDDSQAIEHLGYQPKLIFSSCNNIKLTKPDDLHWLKNNSPQEVSMRIGFGYDSHRFTQGSSIVIGGVNLPHTHAIKAHSDGDVLLHAIADAMLGAAALGDIGQHFPDTSSDNENISSTDIVQYCQSLLYDQHYKIINIDATVITEAPKLSTHMPAIRQSIAQSLTLSVGAVSVKATTNEKMGWIGREEGIAVQAVVLIAKKTA